MNIGRVFDAEKFKENILKRRVLAVISIMVIIPLLFFVFYYVFKQQHYIIMSLLVLLTCILPFFMVFEYRKPRAREVVLLATMTAFAVVSNVICTHTVPLHAGTAIVIITGISLGPEAGFLTGALSRLICNVFDGQGPWTPWQMVAWGLIGFLSGLTFNRADIKASSLFEESTGRVYDSFKIVAGPVVSVIFCEMLGYIIFLIQGARGNFFGWRLYAFGVLGLIVGVITQRKKLPADVVTMTIFTFFVSFIIYGGILNFASMMMQGMVDPESNEVGMKFLRTVYITGVPYDLHHAFGASLVIFFFGEGLIKKLQRVKIKYGIL
ncbi:MAG: ECF transporter S component [Lachnospiraceae bacterium]|nr:ECF transporter S component [Lachnospiraceae bacterium]MCR5202504.1 ECF transporter S component [Lachnospiraceae bacterium]